MSAACITYDELESRADKALAVTLWAKHAKYFVAAVAILTFVDQVTKSLISSMTPERLDHLSKEQTIELTKRLQELHAAMIRVLTMRGSDGARKAPIIGGLLNNLDAHAEDLGDIIDDLVLSEKEEFRSLLAECIQDISAQPAGTSGRM